MSQNIIGMTDGMCHQPYPGKYAASDGTLFGVARVYNTASRNLCVERIAPDGKITLYTDMVHAVPEVADRRAYKACREYELVRPGSCVRFPLHLQDTGIVADRLLRDLGYGVNGNCDRESGYFSLVEQAENPDICAVVCLTEEIQGLPPEDHGYWVHLVDDISDSFCHVYHTDEMTRDSLVQLLEKLTSGVIEAVKKENQEETQ